LWLFAHTAHLRKNIDRLVVLLTAEGDSKVWYAVDKAEQKVHLLSNTPTKVSYRMTAPRFDNELWTNFNHDGVTGFLPPADDLTDYFSENALISFNSTSLAGTTTIAQLISPEVVSGKPWSSALSGMSDGFKNALGLIGGAVVQAYEGAQYFADGIFKRIFAGEVYTDKLCVTNASGQTCITREQLDALIAGAAGSGGAGAGEGEGSGGGEGGGEGTPPDTTPPVINLNGAETLTLSVGDTYIDPTTATDETAPTNPDVYVSVDGGEEVLVSLLNLDTSNPGTFTLSYTAADAAGNSANSSRTVVVE
jgi:hypothetical protein